MSRENSIKEKLAAKFPYLNDKIQIPRDRRINLVMDYASFPEVFEYAITELKFIHLCTITGLDEAEHLSFIYHLAQDSGIMLNIKVSVSKNNPVIKTVTGYFAGADIYEREIVDLLGAKVEGLASGNRYPLRDDWPKGQYPLRKDWKQSDGIEGGGQNA